MLEPASQVRHCAHISDNDILEIDLESFTTLYAKAVKGDLSLQDEEDVVEIASVAMHAPELDENARELFQSAFFILSKKNKSFIDLKKMRKSRK